MVLSIFKLENDLIFLLNLIDVIIIILFLSLQYVQCLHHSYLENIEQSYAEFCQVVLYFCTLKIFIVLIEYFSLYLIKMSI